MCGRYTLTSYDPLERAFGLDAPPLPGPPRYNIAPGQVVAIIHNQPARVLSAAQWGLVPAWARDPAIGHKLINARAETAAEKPAFRDALRTRRCLVVADGFYEWQRPPGDMGEQPDTRPGNRAGRVSRASRAGRKTPYYVRRISREPFGMAGLWACWHAPDGSVLETCTVLTTDANALMAPIHHRMPVILDRSAHGLWLSPDPVRPADLRELLRPPPAEGFEAFAVSPLVNTPHNDVPALIEPVSAAAAISGPDARAHEVRPSSSSSSKTPPGQMSLFDRK